MPLSAYAQTAINSPRRLEAIGPMVDKGTWATFETVQDLSAAYKNQWLSGQVSHEGYPLDFSIRPKRNTKRLAIVFNSQQNSDGKIKLFTWANVAARLDASCLHISDPTLYLSETAVIGWYTCNKALNFQPVLKTIIDLFASALGADEFIFLGSSAGGYPAFYYSQIYGNSTALLLAPSLSAADSRKDKPRQDFLDELNSAETFEDVRKQHADVVLSADEIVSLNNGRLSGSVNIVQSAHDHEFWRDHTSRLLATLDYSSGPKSSIYLDQLSILLGEWGGAHQPPPANVINSAVDDINRVPHNGLRRWRLSPSLLYLGD